MTFEVKATIQMYDTNHGGRQGPTRSEHFQCPVWFGPPSHSETRFFLNEIGPLTPGTTYINVPMDFLCRDLVMEHLFVGKEFKLWEGKDIGAGVITSVRIDLESDSGGR